MKARFWIARDSTPVYRGLKCICLFVGERPVQENGWWNQPKDRSGRHPIPKCGFRIGPGELAEVEIRKLR